MVVKENERAWHLAGHSPPFCCRRLAILGFLPKGIQTSTLIFMNLRRENNIGVECMRFKLSSSLRASEARLQDPRPKSTRAKVPSDARLSPSDPNKNKYVPRIRSDTCDLIEVPSTVEFRPEVHQWRENFPFQIQLVPPPRFIQLGGQGTITFFSMFFVGFCENIEMFLSNISKLRCCTGRGRWTVPPNRFSSAVPVDRGRTLGRKSTVVSFLAAHNIETL